MHAVSGTKPAICEICVALKEDATEWQGLRGGYKVAEANAKEIDEDMKRDLVSSWSNVD